MVEVGNGSPVSSLRMEVVGQPQGYLALRVWVKSGLPLHRRSRRCMPPNQFSVSSLQALKGKGGAFREGGYGERAREKQAPKTTAACLCMLNISKHFGRNKWLMD